VVLVLRWFLAATRMTAPARDKGIGTSTAYDHRDEGIAVPAVRKPSLHGVSLLAATAADHTHVIVDGTLIATDRSTPRPTTGVDLRCN